MNPTVSPERYAQALQDYERLLSREHDPALDRYRADNQPSLLTREGSTVDAARVAILEELAFQPAVKTRSIMKDGSTIDTETWVDPSGGTTVELSAALEQHFVSTYFSDGTAVTVWPSDSITANQPTPNRTNIRGADDLGADIRTALAAREAGLASGLRQLLVVDVRTAELHDEFHSRFLHADPVKVALTNVDTSQLWKAEFYVSLGILVLLGLAAVGYALIFGRSTTVFVLLGLLAVYQLGQSFKVWRNRHEPRSPFPGLSDEAAEKLLREMIDKQESGDSSASE